MALGLGTMQHMSKESAIKMVELLEFYKSIRKKLNNQGVAT